MDIRTRGTILLALLFAGLTAAFLFVHGLFIRTDANTGRLSKADACEDSIRPSVAKENPSKLLFVSCGGFLD